MPLTFGFSLTIYSILPLASLIGAAIAADNAIPLHSTLDVDVCVIGGGASGTYAAIKSLDLNKTAAIVELQDRLGGHTNTYIDPASDTPIEYGVAEYPDIPIVRNWFGRFKISLYDYNYTIPGVTTAFADFQIGKSAVPKPTNLTKGWDTFQVQEAKYPFLNYNLSSVPYPVPQDLLLPFGQFIKKYGFQDAVPFLSLLGQGWGNFVTLPTLLAIKYFPPSPSLPVAFGGTGGVPLVAAKSNSLVYEKAQEELGANVLLKSKVSSMDRSDANVVKVTVQTPTGKKLIRAKKLVSTIPPIIENLKGFDLDAQEVTIFNKFRGHSWYVGLVKNSGIPSNLTIFNYGSTNDENFNIPVLPAIYEIYATQVPSLHWFLFGGNDSQPFFTRSQVENSLRATIQRLQNAGTIPPKASMGKFEIVAFSDHSPYEVYVSSDQISRGFYNRLFELQGQKNTYWSGAAFVTHSSPAVWQFTDELVTSIWSGS